MNETLYHTKYLDIKKTTTQNGDDWFYAHRPNASDVVIILPIYNNEVLFLIEKRPPIQAEAKGIYTIGLAAGLVGDERIGECIEDALKAELIEETGLIAESFEIKARKVASSAGCISETFVIAIARIKNKKIVKEPISDNGVIVDRVWVKKDNIYSWLQTMENKGHVLTAQALASLFYMNEKENL